MHPKHITSWNAQRYLPRILRCTASAPGTFNHECNKPADYVAKHANGFIVGRCQRCNEQKIEAAGLESLEALPPAIVSLAHDIGQALSDEYGQPSNSRAVRLHEMLERINDMVSPYGFSLFFDGFALESKTHG